MARTFRDAPDRSRFELHDGDELLGWMDYRPAGRSAILAHTEVAGGHEGEGLGGVLVRELLNLLEADGRTVIPTCPFAAAYIKRHPELARHVDPSLRGQFT
jgi:predicted GNAT family acetyltransferase